MGTLKLVKRKRHNNNWGRGKGPDDVVVRRAKGQNEMPPLTVLNLGIL